MSVLKAELKQLITGEIGVRVEDSLDAAKRELAVLEGRQAAFMDGSKAAEALMASVDRDVTEGKYDLPTAEQVKRYVARCIHALQNLAAQAQNYRIAQTGKVQGLEQTVILLKGLMDAERAKAAALTAATAEAAPALPAEQPTAAPVGPSRGRPEGMAPPPTIKAQRLAEEAAAKAAPPAAVKARGGRKPRASYT